MEKNLYSQIQSKTNEIHDLTNKQFQQIKQKNKTQHAEILSLRSQLEVLKSDFEYNLRLLDERDSELKQYEKRFLQVRQEYMKKDKENEQLRYEMDEWKERLHRERAKEEDIIDQWDARVNQLEREKDMMREMIKKQLRKKELDFDHVMREHQMKHQEEIDRLTMHMKGNKIQHEKLVTSLQKEIITMQTEVDKLHQTIQHLKKEGENKEREWSTKTNLQNEQILALKETMETIRINQAKEIGAMEAQHNSHVVELQKTLETRIQQINEQLIAEKDQVDRCNLQLKKERFQFEDKLKEKNHELTNVVDKFKKDEQESLKHIQNMKDQLMEYEVELKHSKQVIENYKETIRQQDENISHLKQELFKASEREQNLKKSQLQDHFNAEQKMKECQDEVKRKQMEYTRQIENQRDDCLKRIDKLTDENQHLKKELQLKSEALNHANIQLHHLNKETKLNYSAEIDRELDIGNLPAPSIPSMGGFDTPRGEYDFPETPKDESPKKRTIFPTPEVMKQSNHAELKILQRENQLLQERIQELQSRNYSKDNSPQQTNQIIHDLKEDLSEARYQIRVKIEKIKRLEHQLEEAKENLLKVESKHQNQNHDLCTVIQELKSQLQSQTQPLDQINHLNQELGVLRAEYEREKEDANETYKAAKNLKHQNKKLKYKLQEAATDLKKLIRDREKLIDQNNMYKQQLKKQNPTKEQPISEEYKKKQEAVVEQYKKMIEEARHHIEELSRENQRLVSELEDFRKQEAKAVLENMIGDKKKSKKRK